MGKMRNAYKILLGKSLKKTSFMRFWHRWENIKMGFHRNMMQMDISGLG
jgi:hypothetical protein